jgi:Zn-dependent protease
METPFNPVPSPTEPVANADAFGRPKRSWIREKLSAVGAAVIALLAKLKAILLFLPKIKLLVTAGTAVASVGAYALIWGFPFAAGFVVLIFIHEMGHVIALRREGIKASAPMFIPFMGAVITAILGSIAAAAVAILGLATHTSLLEALGYTGLFLNLFNLLPVVPLDGGRAMAAMAPWMWFLGFGVMVFLDFYTPNPILLIITLVAGFELYRRWERRRIPTPAQTAYYRVSPRNRLLVASVYIGLIVALAVGMHFTYLHRTFN